MSKGNAVKMTYKSSPAKKMKGMTVSGKTPESSGKSMGKQNAPYPSTFRIKVKEAQERLAPKRMNSRSSGR